MELFASVFGDLSDEELAGVIEKRVQEEEDAVRVAMARKGREFLGKTRILALSPHTRSESFEPLGKLNPRVAASHRSRRIEAIARLKVFLQSYREALDRYLGALKVDFERARLVIFPAGTYLMRVRYAVRCHAPP